MTNPNDLQRSISGLESSLDHLGNWLLIATALVVLGLVLEYFHQIPESIREFKRKRSWGPICIIAGGLLITVGVAGELVVQNVASRQETALRKANDELFTDLNTEAAKARKDAGDAIERASVIEKEAARLSKEAEDERMARVELERKVAWRRIFKSEQPKAASGIKRFAGQSALISCSATDQEAKSFSADIAAILHQAGWDVPEPLENIGMHEGPAPFGTNPPNPTGVLV
jgi:hypothetical protein